MMSNKHSRAFGRSNHVSTENCVSDGHDKEIWVVLVGHSPKVTESFWLEASELT